MTTDWKWRMGFFVRAVDATALNKQTFALIYVNNGSGQTLDDELGMFDSLVKLSVSGELPAQAYGINTAIKTAMRDDLKAFLDTLTNARYVVTANTALPNYFDGEFVSTNFPNAPDMEGKRVTWQMVLTYLYNEFGLQVIPDNDV